MKKISNHAAPEFIARREEFTSHTGNFRGETHVPGTYLYTGQLPRAYANRGDVVNADYVVFSYSTPIAWHLADGWVFPDVIYSITTSGKHQGPTAQGIRGEYSALDLPNVRTFGPTAAKACRLLRHGYSVPRRTTRVSTLQPLVDAGEASWNEDQTELIPPL